MRTNSRFRIGWRDTYRILAPYVQRNFTEQLKGIWFIVAYLALFQVLVLKLPIVYAAMIGVGIALFFTFANPFVGQFQAVAG